MLKKIKRSVGEELAKQLNIDFFGCQIKKNEYKF